MSDEAYKQWLVDAKKKFAAAGSRTNNLPTSERRQPRADENEDGLNTRRSNEIKDDVNGDRRCNP